MRAGPGLPTTGAIAVALLSASTGCEAEFSGFGDLFEYDPTYVNLPGRRIVEGRYSGANVVGTDSSGAYVVAFDREHASSLLIQRLDDETPCRVGPAGSYQILRVVDGVTQNELPFMVPYLNTSGRYGLLSLVDGNCRPVIDPIEGASLPADTPFAIGDPPGFITVTSDREVWFASPISGETRRIATSVERDQIGFTYDPNRIWLREGEQVVVRDARLEERARFGSRVTQLAVWSQTDQRVAYVDDGTLYMTRSETSEPEVIDQDVCNVRFPAGWNGFGLSYFSPCSERNLVLLEQSRLGDASPGRQRQRYEIGGPALGTPSMVTSDEVYVFYLTNDDAEADLGTLHGGPIGGPYERIGEQSRLSPLASRGGGVFRLIVERGELGGRLIDWSPGKPIHVRAEHVQSFAGPFALAGFDGETGNAVAIGESNEYTVATGVPPNGYREGYTGRALLSDFTNGTGTLLAGSGREGSNGALTDFEVVAHRVPVGGFGFVDSLGAIGYLRDFDPEAGMGILAVRVLETADVFDIGTRADTLKELVWPRAALLYTVPSGESRGIWYAEIR